MAGRLRPQGL